MLTEETGGISHHNPHPDETNEPDKFKLRAARLDDSDTIAPYLIKNLPPQLAGSKVLNWGPYAVMPDGRVYSFRERPGWLKAQLNGEYLQVWLKGYSGKTRWFKVHRLVATLFVRAAGVVVKHKDKNKQNNHYTNLEWVARRGQEGKEKKRGRRRKKKEGRLFSEEAKQKMSVAKIGERHPKFKGWYEYKGERHASLRALAGAVGVSGPTAKRWLEKGEIKFEKV